jgi:hypothetical protein
MYFPSSFLFEGDVIKQKKSKEKVKELNKE